MLDPVTVITRLGGIARGSQLRAHGISRNRLARDVAQGNIVRVRPGVFAVPATDAHVRTAAAHGGALTCGSALRRYRVWVLDDTKLHVWLGENGRRHAHPGCECTTHHFAGPTTFGVAPIESALLHLYACAGDESFFAAFESAWRKRMLSATARARIRAGLPESARWLIDVARGDADSGLESLLRLRLHVLGIPLNCQVIISGVGRVDFVVGGCLILEADGEENHGSAGSRHRDRKRDAAASVLGYETLRFDYAQIVHDWATVQSAILAALRRARR
ncbi:type IV toxin-antitoxin system AbiEi family antitoxin domain-containing protein [Microbacterium keratanolyticum]